MSGKKGGDLSYKRRAAIMTRWEKDAAAAANKAAGQLKRLETRRANATTSGLSSAAPGAAASAATVGAAARAPTGAEAASAKAAALADIAARAGAAREERETLAAIARAALRPVLLAPVVPRSPQLTLLGGSQPGVSPPPAPLRDPRG